MLTLFKSGLLALCVALTLASCSDHRLGGPQSPVRLRLKSFTEGANTTTYTYDSQNRIATITRPQGTLGVFSYDDPDKKATYFFEYPNPADRSKGAVTIYPFDFQLSSSGTNNYSIVGKNYGSVDINLINSYGPTPNTLFSYYFDANKRLLTYATSDGNNSGTSIKATSPTFTGENITQSDFSAKGYGLIISSLTYDDKINPFFGLMDPAIDVIERYSRNNRVSINTPSYNEVKTYVYEYNAQGLPTKRTQTAGGTKVITFTYEGY